jgi:Fe-S-cluster containining protein
MTEYDAILDRYGMLLAEVDAWFARCREAVPGAIACGDGCADCCRGLFDITLLDACHLKRGFDRLPSGVRNRTRRKGRGRLTLLRRLWPEFAPPYLLNYRPEGEWEALMPEEDNTPCPLLEDGRCLVYEHRPMTCRLNGIPLLDHSGEIMYDEWCTLNFTSMDPLSCAALRGDFRRLFGAELELFRELTGLLLGNPLNELDTFIPLALLVDYRRFPWREWLGRTRIILNSPC